MSAGKYDDATIRDTATGCPILRVSDLVFLPGSGLGFQFFFLDPFLIENSHITDEKFS